MKLRTLFIICLVLMLLYIPITCSYNGNVNDEKSIDYIPPVPTKWKTKNGINVIYYRDKELPIVRASLYIRGSVDKINKLKIKNPLVLEAMGTLLKAGGTKKYPTEKLNLKLEKLSASLSSSWGSEYGEISFSSLLEDTEELFKIVSDMVFNPSFDKKELELWKLRKIDSIKRRLDSPSSIAKLKYQNLLYKTSMYGYISNENDIKNITQRDLFDAKEKYIKPKDVYLTIVGPITKKKIERLIDTYFQDWKDYKGKNVSSDDEMIRHNFKPVTKQIYFMKKDDLNQATVFVISKGPRLDETMHVKYAVFSSYLGTGGFSSVLVKDLRTNKGLVYTTYGGVFPSVPYGVSTIFIETSDDKLNNALKSAEKIVSSFKSSENIDTNTLKQVKNAMLNAEIFKTASYDTLVDRNFTFDFWGFSSNYDKLYKKRVNSFNESDLMEIGNKYMDLDNSFVVIVASSKALDNLKDLMKDNESIFSKYNLNLCDVMRDGLCEK